MIFCSNVPESVDLLAVDFEDTVYGSTQYCALAKALRRLYPKAIMISAGSRLTYIRNRWWNFPVHPIHDYYGPTEFDVDCGIAADHNYDNTVIRTIKFY